ncbi:MAG TPA: hypothetical protein VFA48_12680 [Gammaproteobacteria bacterium]|nr:hypothetical protein [Gammaproteobacteria bacterium]
MPDTNSMAEQTSKVAVITLSFWIIKVVTTTAGDLSGDMLSISLGLGYVTALIVAVSVMAALLAFQLGARRFHYLLYWALILLSSTVGAEISDSMDRALHIGTLGGAAVFLACLVATLSIWRLSSGKIRFYPVIKRQDEAFYWTAAIFANCLGSAIGDLVGDRLGFGVLGGVAVNAGVLAFLVMLRFKTKANRGVLFWVAFVFSRVSF